MNICRVGKTVSSCTVIVICILTVLVWNLYRASAVVVDSYQLRALVLSRIMLSVHWPDDKLKKGNTTITIGIISRESDRYVSDFKQAGHILETRGISLEVLKLPQPGRSASVDMAELGKLIKRCDVIYTSDDMRKKYHEIFTGLTNSGLLTVGEDDLFCRSGGMICLNIRKKRLKIVINLRRLKQAGYGISSEVLQHARIIQ